MYADRNKNSIGNDAGNTGYPTTQPDVYSKWSGCFIAPDSKLRPTP
jgi:hypothetical protein